ncbi:MAG: hypothetical protein ACOC2D_05230 [Spirochaetota bacterium]
MQLAVAFLPILARPLSAAESALIVVDPVSSVAARVVVQSDRSERVVLTTRGGPNAPSARLGVDLSRLVAGPVTLDGAFAELARPASGGPTSPRWCAPASVALDASLVPGTRAGVYARATPTAGAAAWLADDTLTAAAAVRLEARALFADGVAAVSRPLEVEAPGIAGLVRRAFGSQADDDPLDTAWFEGPPRPHRVLHVVARAGGVARCAAGSAAVVASLPNATHPGLGVRLAARAEPARWLRVSVLASLASPDLLDASGDPVGPPARWRAEATVGRRLALALGAGRAYSAPQAAYAAVALMPERLTTGRTDCSARLSLRPGRGWMAGEGETARDEPLVRFRSASIGGLVRTEPGAPLGWRADTRTALELAAGAVEVEPSLRLDAVEGLRLRLRAVVAGGQAIGPATGAVALVGHVAYEIPAGLASSGDDAEPGTGELAGGLELRLELEREEIREREPTDPE